MDVIIVQHTSNGTFLWADDKDQVHVVGASLREAVRTMREKFNLHVTQWVTPSNRFMSVEDCNAGC